MSHPFSTVHGVGDFRRSARVADAVRDLPMSLPYSRLFGADFVIAEDTRPFRRMGRRVGDLERL